MGDRP